MMPADHVELVARAQRGDKEAFAKLYQAYFERIYDFAYQLVRNQADASDICQDTFVACVERIGTLHDPAAFRGWLYAIARNRSLNLIERRKRVTSMPEDSEPLDLSRSSTPDPEAGVESNELVTLIWEAASTLNPRDYSIFEMTVRQGLAPGEVAQALALKPSHAYVLISRVKDTIEDALAAVVIARVGRRDCAALDAVVTEFGSERSSRMRQALQRHMRGCETCERNRRRYASPAALLQGVAFAVPPVGLMNQIQFQIDDAWGRHPVEDDVAFGAGALEHDEGGTGQESDRPRDWTDDEVSFSHEDFLPADPPALSGRPALFGDDDGEAFELVDDGSSDI